MSTLTTLLAEHRLTAVLALALLLGLAFGGLAQWRDFCLLQAIRQQRLHGRREALQAFAAAMLSALLCTQALAFWLGIPLEQTVYAQPRLTLGLAIGGLLFGAGMTLSNACGARSLVLLGTGNLRVLLTLLCMAVAAGASLSGVLAPLRLQLADIGFSLPAATLPGWLQQAGASDTAARLIAVLLLALPLALVLRRPADPSAAGGRGRLAAAVLIGLLISLGWVTTGVVGADDFEPVPLASLSFVAPVSDSLLYLQLSTGVRAGFGVLLVAGVVLGAFLAAAATGRLRWQGFESVGQMQRSAMGGMLMGFGGVMALGCSVGQGLSGLSTLSLSTLVAFPAIVLGSLLAMRRPREGF